MGVKGFLEKTFWISLFIIPRKIDGTNLRKYAKYVEKMCIDPINPDCITLLCQNLIYDSGELIANKNFET